MRIVFFLQLLFSVFIYTGCTRLEGKSFVPAIDGYDEPARKHVILEKKLREISGIHYIDPNRLAAINDESGKIFIVDPSTGKYETYNFAGKGDYEDVVIVDRYFYILRSDGHIFKVNRSNYKVENEFAYDFGKHTEFESMYHDSELRQLVLICKECCRNCTSINAFKFDLDSERFDPDVYFSIGWKEIRTMARDNQIEIKPSAAAIHPVTNKLFIIASVGKILLECSRNGVLEKVHAINPYHFQQPEGLTFAPDGGLYISNESVQGKATLVYFPFKK